MSDTVQGILDSAERFIRRGGFHAFSFRQIAEEIGIKSASVHYHFPTKEALGVAVTRRYHDRFMDFLGDPAESSRTPQKQLEHFQLGFLGAFEKDGAICLCGMLLSEAAELPKAVREAVRDFVEAQLVWLSAVVARAQPRSRAVTRKAIARTLFGAMQGALAQSILEQDPAAIVEVGGVMKKILAGPKAV